MVFIDEEISSWAVLLDESSQAVEDRVGVGIILVHVGPRHHGDVLAAFEEFLGITFDQSRQQDWDVGDGLSLVDSLNQSRHHEVEKRLIGCCLC